MEELGVVALGCLLHDIGKVVQRADSNPKGMRHSEFGYEFLKNARLVEANKYWQWVLECVRYHHARDIFAGNASLPIAWFAYEADNLASAHDRRSAPEFFDGQGDRLEETEPSLASLWDPLRRLDCVFSHFTGGADYGTKWPLWFRRMRGTEWGRELYPYPQAEANDSQAIVRYQELRDYALKPLVDSLKSRDPASLETVDMAVHYLEENLSMVPPDTNRQRTNDVSLFDHLKLTAAIGTAMYAYVAEAHPDWLSQSGNRIPWSRDFRKEQAYLLVKADISGIQEFIYNISSKAALKGLRGRSFYLELLQSQLATALLRSLSLSKANLIYQGGGGFVILAPNTSNARKTIDKIRAEFNRWLFNEFRGRLYLGLEYAAVSGGQLQVGGSEATVALADAWREIWEKLTQAKRERFKECIEEIFTPRPYKAECRICYRDDVELELLPGSEDLTVCPMCAQLVALGANLPEADWKADGRSSSELHILDASAGGAAVVRWNPGTGSLEPARARIELPASTGSQSQPLHNFDAFRPPALVFSLREYRGNQFEDLAAAARGVKRIGVLRADVDNLGKVFSGIDPSIGLPASLRSMSRDAAVSRALARFFSHYLDDLLRAGCAGADWAITTVYAGGDDVFLVGAWDQIVNFALLLEGRFKAYCAGKLTISAGVSIHKKGYPLYKMAEDAADAEHCAKTAGKDRLCVLFDERIHTGAHCFTWHHWRSAVKPLADEIEFLTEDAGIPAAFWNYLLAYARPGGPSFYRLLYNTARMEERLRRLADEPRWMAFKRRWLMLDDRAAVNQERRLTLETALNWFLLRTRETVRADVVGSGSAARGR